MAVRQPWDELREAIEDEMRSLARQLPAWPWVAGINGVRGGNSTYTDKFSSSL
jgi:hypothetical protein